MQEYIQQELDRKNRRIYFKKGRWLLHVLLWSIVYFFGFNAAHGKFFSAENFFYAFVWDNWTFALFFYTYCLYLIPVYFKRNRQAGFWTLLILSMTLAAAVELCFQALLEPYIPAEYRSNWQLSGQGYWRMLYGRYFTNFIILSIFLFMMELAEGLRTHGAIYSETDARIATEQQLIKTRMNPEFMMRALDGIIRLSEDQNTGTADSVISFADVLRYRLYHTGRSAPLGEELRHLEQLFAFQRSISGLETAYVLELNGDPAGRMIVPLALINLAEAALITQDGSPRWSLLLYLLIEDGQLQVALEVETGHPEANSILAGIERSMRSILDSDCNFTLSRNANTYSITLCIPTPASSAA